MASEIKIVGAKQHNLKNINITIPRDSLVVITGLSGSGKSSLAFDTLYAEGQRRYVESLSAYARQFLDRLQKPDVEHIEGLSPAIAIEQRTAGSNPRSIVATTTEIYDYLRLLYAHVGQPHCPKCAKKISSQTPQSICKQIMQYKTGTKLMILAPYIIGKKGEHKDIIDKIRSDGFVRIRLDQKIISLDDEFKISKTKRHNIEAVVDRLIIGKTNNSRLTDSVELALKLAEGIITILIEDKTEKSGWKAETMSEHLACPECKISFAKLQPRNFSFNSPFGACPECHGLGNKLIFIPEKLIKDPNKPIKNGAAPLWRRGGSRVIIFQNHLLRCLAEHYPEFDLKTPWNQLPKKIQNILLYGSGKEIIDFNYTVRRKRYKKQEPFEGIIPNMLRRFMTTDSEFVRTRMREAMGHTTCPTCQGQRLKPAYLAVTIGKLNIHQFCALSITDSLKFMQKLTLSKEKQTIANEITKEIANRLGFLTSVGLGYLNLNRKSGTLSGGEAQRIRLATQVGSGLMGVLYILDEPSIGLHQRDNMKLLNTLKKLRDQGNSIIVVEHDLETIQEADFIVDLGPQAGKYGGELVCAGTPQKIAKCKKSLTGQFLSGTQKIPIPKKRLKGIGKQITITEASEHNLKKITTKIPLGTFTCITGVSGSGKSTLINTILQRAIKQHFNLKTDPPGKHKNVTGLKAIDKMIVIDQSPIGRTPRSNPATYTDSFGIIRDIFAKLPEAKIRGYKPGRFSFNVKGGRCEACKGDGIKKIEMQFLPDVYVQCEICKGRRYNNETLSIKYRGRNIADVLEMTVDEAAEFFTAIPRLQRKLTTLVSVGLGYIHLGQAATTLSGGEAQRVKLATELAKQPIGHTLYILDEPTTGLHLADIKHLMQLLQNLRDQGNTILVIEHNLDVIKVADHIIDLGPEGGDAGGTIIASGTPEQIAKCKKSYTGKYLKEILNEQK